MNWIVVNVFVCILGLALLAGLPAFFGWKNTMQATKEQYANTLKELAKLDKQYMPHTNQLNKNLNTIN